MGHFYGSFFRQPSDVDLSSWCKSTDTKQKSHQLHKSDHTVVTTVELDKANFFFNSDIKILVVGSPYWKGNVLAELDQHRGAAHCLFNGYNKYGIDIFSKTHGDFSIVIVDEKNNCVFMAVDRIGIRPLSYECVAGGIVFGTRVNYVASHPQATKTISQQSIYNYLYYHMVPSPGCIYKNQQKLEPAQIIRFEQNEISKTTYWQPNFSEKMQSSVEYLSAELKTHIKNSVEICTTGNENKTGTFLSGGIDSSTVSGMFSNISEQPVRSYSIGFDAEGYDEIEYAKIAAKKFSLDSHVYYVTPDDVYNTIPLIAEFYDEPYGNSSALPAYHCAKFAKADGIDCLLAGDGGDEFFAGNDRYAKQKIFEVYGKIPLALRCVFPDAMLAILPDALKKGPVQKLESYVKQARIPLPDRLETYNLFHMMPPSEILNDDFLSVIDFDANLNIMRDRYNAVDDAGILNKMLYLDWKLTLADNDLRKVNRMCEMADMQVKYPLINDELIKFSTQIPSDLKMKNNTLRYFFKKSMEDFLPQEILYKTKQGFGLPFGIWLRTSPKLIELVNENLLSFRKRKYIKDSFLDLLMKQHQQGHASFYGGMVWVIMMLEMWLSAHEKP